jgi:glycerol-3-phosphate acyltransferase PlsY
LTSLDIAFIVIALLVAYLIGSFPTAYIVARLKKGTDIRAVGSRNLGAMNVFYSVGFWWGMLVLMIDIGKGALGVGVAHFLKDEMWVQMLAGVAVVLGHGFPVFLKFRGGRGGASCIGILVYLMPWGTPIYGGLFGLLLLITRFPTLSYSAAFVCFPFIGAFIYHSWELVVYSVGIVIVPLLKYITRIIEMRRIGGSWRHVVYRKNLKDRL